MSNGEEINSYRDVGTGEEVKAVRYNHYDLNPILELCKGHMLTLQRVDGVVGHVLTFKGLFGNEYRAQPTDWVVRTVSDDIERSGHLFTVSDSEFRGRFEDYEAHG